MRYIDMLHTLSGTLLRVFSVFLFLGQLFVCQRMIHLRRKKAILLLSVVNALLGVLLFSVLVEEPEREVYGASLRFHGVQMQLCLLPWWAILAMEAVLALLLGILIQDIFRFSRSNITTDTIKEAVDALPEGICFGDAKGEALLSNLSMMDACFALTGRPLQDTLSFWKAVMEKGEEQEGHYLVRKNDGKALLFSRSVVTMNGNDYDQIIASDVTEPARISEELREKNAELWAVQYRMKAYQARAAEMVMEEELLTARTEVHDGLGHLLLMGRYYLDHPEKTEETELLRLLQQSSSSLLAEAEELPAPRDFYAEALRRAGRIGVHVEIEGDVPEAGKERELIGHALNECAANTVKHAGGQNVKLSIEKQEDGLHVTLSNDGEVPSEPIREIGGLRTLRRLTEDAGGSMTLDCSSCFRLMLVLPENRN